MAGERHIWEGRLRECLWGDYLITPEGETLPVDVIMAHGKGKNIRITVEVLENGGGGTEEASRREGSANNE